LTFLIGVYIGGIVASIIQRWLTSLVLFGEIKVQTFEETFMAYMVSATWPVSIPVLMWKMTKRE
jgi:hypothetical protein